MDEGWHTVTIQDILLWGLQMLLGHRVVSRMVVIRPGEQQTVMCGEECMFGIVPAAVAQIQSAHKGGHSIQYHHFLVEGPSVKQTERERKPPYRR